MINHPIPVQLAHDIRVMCEVVFRNFRRAENALAQYPSPQTRAILDALSRAERELGIADAHLRQIVPDDVLFAQPEPWRTRLRRFYGGANESK